MVTLSDSLVSSSARRLTIRVRPDLSARRQYYLGQAYWVVKEPVGLNYFRFQEEEYAILRMIDGATSLDEIKERFEAEFPPQKITLEELQQFIGMLHKSGLVIADVPGQGKQLKARRDEKRRKEILGALSNILCIRFKGFDPERLLNRMYPYLKWMFSPVTLFFCLVLIVSAATLVVVQFDVFQSKLPGFYQFFSPTNALLLAATLGIAKVFHEFGHGLTCNHFGGECHEMGVMILVLTPCLYCNVSDSWMLPNKWQRAAIGAAGMFVEVVLASICTFIWWFTEPGLINNLCLNIMFIASVTTLIFNANPLLRYDGYYILADITEIPNLRQKATQILSRKAGQWFLGIEPPEDPFLPQRKQMFFVFYSVAAACYRWFVMASILYFLYQVFKPYRLEIIGHAIIAMSLFGLIVMPLYKLFKFFYVPGRLEKVKKPRMFASLAGLALIGAGVFFIPLPHSVFCTFEVQPRDAEPVYVTVPGILLESNVKPGDRVKQGDLLAVLQNLDLQLEIARLTGEAEQYDRQLESLAYRRFDDPEAAASVEAVEKASKAVHEQLATKRRDAARLVLKAPIDGVVMPPPLRPDKKDPNGQLPPWSGMPTDDRNLGCTLEESTLFCQIGDPKTLEAMLIVDQGDVIFLQKGQKVEVKFDALPLDITYTTLTELPTRDIQVAPQRLAAKAGGDLATVTDESGVERPQSASYPAMAPLENPDGTLRIGLRGRAKIHTEPKTLWQRASRFVQQTLNFKL